MKHHLSSATQHAKEIAFSGTQPPIEAENIDHESSSPSSLTFRNINTPIQTLGILNPKSKHQAPEPASLFQLLLLSFILAVVLVLAIYVIFHTFSRGYALAFEDFAPQYARKLQKKRPPPLHLVGDGDDDVEAQPLRMIAVNKNGDDHRRAERHHNPFEFGEDAWETPSGTSTGVDADGEGLTPFTPARARARRYGEGDVEAVGEEEEEEEEDELGLEKYFFGNGVGICRYDSTEKMRGWKEG